jgi:hypothetical protein
MAQQSSLWLSTTASSRSTCQRSSFRRWKSALFRSTWVRQTSTGLCASTCCSLDLLMESPVSTDSECRPRPCTLSARSVHCTIALQCQLQHGRRADCRSQRGLGQTCRPSQAVCCVRQVAAWLTPASVCPARVHGGSTKQCWTGRRTTGGRDRPSAMWSRLVAPRTAPSAGWLATSGAKHGHGLITLHHRDGLSLCVCQTWMSTWTPL